MYGFTFCGYLTVGIKYLFYLLLAFIPKTFLPFVPNTADQIKIFITSAKTINFDVIFAVEWNGNILI